jgi:ketosteroid isomerase-like protein
MESEELDRLFRANARGVDGVVAQYEPDAVMPSVDGLIRGTAAIRPFYQRLLSGPLLFACEIQPSLRHGNVALTSARFAGGATAETARRQADGTWLWIADQPNLAG